MMMRGVTEIIVFKRGFFFSFSQGEFSQETETLLSICQKKKKNREKRKGKGPHVVNNSLKSKTQLSIICLDCKLEQTYPQR